MKRKINIFELLKVLVIVCFLYILQFQIIPLLLNDSCKWWSGGFNEANAVWLITSFVAFMLGTLFITRKFWVWILGILCYILLIISFPPDGMYGIYLSESHLTRENIMWVLLVCGIRTVILCFMCGVSNFVCKILTKRQNKKKEES